ncbi:hypothetical protein [Kordia sp.]|uniref:hypothetical protein n=1 Tax=Kordia sp. TaxID=1965332 RepID=UPI003D27193F
MCIKKTHPIPGIRLLNNHFDYGFVTDIPDPNRQLSILKAEKLAKRILKLIKTVRRQRAINLLRKVLKINDRKARQHYRRLRRLIQKCKCEQAFQQIVDLLHPKSKNKIEKRFSEIYDNQLDITIQPTIGALRSIENSNGSCESKIYTNIYFYENFKLEKGKEGFTKDDFDIYQNFSMGEDDRLRLCYYVCFKRSNKRRGSIYRMHKFSIVNAEINHIPFGQCTNEKLNPDEIDDVVTFLINVNPEASRGTVTTVKDPTSGS